MNINETTPQSVEKTETAENAENIEKSGNTIIILEISISTLAARIIINSLLKQK